MCFGQCSELYCILNENGRRLIRKDASSCITICKPINAHDCNLQITLPLHLSTDILFPLHFPNISYCCAPTHPPHWLASLLVLYLRGPMEYRSTNRNQYMAILGSGREYLAPSTTHPPVVYTHVYSPGAQSHSGKQTSRPKFMSTDYPNWSIHLPVKISSRLEEQSTGQLQSTITQHLCCITNASTNARYAHRHVRHSSLKFLDLSRIDGIVPTTHRLHCSHSQLAGVRPMLKSDVE
ncbi:hypothetical protein EGR_03704 [Echinococcus granulosus]|uniref:Uncharacterized protein n=1 Tax=Echinococcus granulosus TaxID=6210 RepID=W6V570_ECHGR|nr:hypothetical protein EGR_03704 [Echinococcus granulosus]EUB61414.1 hypothetical protein EGR_03704 [Echinococcus granulosus]